MYILNIVKITLKAFFALILSYLVFLFASCAVPDSRYEKLLGTVCFVNLYESGSEDCYNEIFDRLKQIDDEFSIDQPQSDLYRINTFSGERDVEVCDDVFTVLEMAQKVSALTNGAFDITVEPLVSLWHVTSETPHVAEQSEINEVLPLVDYKKVILNSKDKTVRFAKKGMKLDLGGIAKGFAANEIVKICKKYKVRRAVIDLGGNVYVYGKKKKTGLWNVGIKNPEHPDMAPLVKLTLPEISVVTSGTYERYFETTEKLYHHILSPADGYPVDNELYSVSVISEDSMLADALTTAFFVLGRKQSMALLPSLREQFGLEIEAVFIQKNHNIFFSKKFPFKYTVLYEDWQSASD